MLSIVICSVNQTLLEKVKKNISETVGTDHEIIVIDNSGNNYSICKAYNEGGSKARFEYICFMHEDVCFNTTGWGHLACNHLANENVGLIGVAGGDTKGIVPSSWSVPAISNEINIIQHYKRDTKAGEHVVVTNIAKHGLKKKVVSLDGVWLCTKKKVFNEFKFDEITFPGFHGYDIDYSLQVNTKYDLFVVFDILIQHYSEGSPDRNWIRSAFMISKKWKKNLPVSAYEISAKEFNIHYWNSLQVLIKHLIRLKYSNLFVVSVFAKYSFNRFFHVRRFLSSSKFLVIEINKRKKPKSPVVTC